ncbi:MAG: hypothetical protein J1F01_03555 [Oscillospiraceae bacterium]|nr:hypothetical protein [Oscillospiraceae bacterium]
MKKTDLIKKLIVTALVAAPVFNFAYADAANANTGEIIGKIYSTDILAYVNGRQAPSYNIGGRTVIVIEDLAERGYGIGYDYNDDERTLMVEASFWPNSNIFYGDGPAIERGTVGKIVGDVYSTDIEVIFNDSKVPSYNIGGKTAVCIEDLGKLDGSSPNEEYGFSKYLCNYEWDAENKTISLNSAGGYMMHEIGISSIKYLANDNVLTAEYSPFNDFSSGLYVQDGYTYKNSEEFNAEKNIIKPLYLKTGDELNRVGLCWANDNNSTEIYFDDIDMVRSYVSALITPPTPYEETLSILNDGINYKTIDRMELEKYDFLVVESLKEDNIWQEDYHDVFYFIAAKNGGFVNVYQSSTLYTERTLEQTGANSLTVTVWPFAGPHGATSMNININCEDYII